jgi:hypothetical protein
MNNRRINLAKPNLNDERILSSAEACRLWGIDSFSLRKIVQLLPEGTIGKLGRDWIVKFDRMANVFGKFRENLATIDIEPCILNIKQKTGVLKVVFFISS